MSLWMYDEDGLFGLKDYTLFEAVWYIMWYIYGISASLFLIISEKKNVQTKWQVLSHGIYVYV